MSQRTLCPFRAFRVRLEGKPAGSTAVYHVDGMRSSFWFGNRWVSLARFYIDNETAYLKATRLRNRLEDDHT